ncbi:hypothetical protein COOONC_04101 [Cooperia oncophora]
MQSVQYYALLARGLASAIAVDLPLSSSRLNRLSLPASSLHNNRQCKAKPWQHREGLGQMSRPAFEQFTAQPPQPAGEFVAQQQTMQGEAMAAQGQELTIAKLENSVATMEEQQLTTDPRYQKMLQLKSKLTGSSKEVYSLRIFWLSIQRKENEEKR